MKKLLIVFGHHPAPVKDSILTVPRTDNAERSGANGHKTDAIGY